MKIRGYRTILAFILTSAAIFVLFFIAVNTGGLKTSLSQLLNGLFKEYDKTVAIIFELRFPRIIVALLGGALMAVSGVCMQAVMKNPLADPGIIGISSGAAFAAVLVAALFPALAVFIPIFSFLGGIVAFLLVYSLAWKGEISPIRLILVGIAVDAVFAGLYKAFEAMTGGRYSGAANIINANISLKTWGDVKMLTIYTVIAVVLCVFIVGKCNLLALSDQAMHGLGIKVGHTRIVVSIVSVLLASIFTAVIGTVSFLGLIVPHIARLLVGSDHKVLIPYSALLGGFIFLLADTLGRSVAYPYEISSSIVMALIGGPVFICLLKRSRGVYGK
ncbi:MAG: iron ABC transporter permease [Clostridiales bacterium]|nr:iron ABC transporter permease [Clostridiales bacterium]